MSDPSLALQGWIVSALKPDGVLPVVVGGRIYDRPPANPTFPYVTIGPGHLIGDDTEDCGDASEVFQQVDVWSRQPGFPEVKSIVPGIRTALKAIPALAGFNVTVAQFQDCQYLDDPDGITRHAALTFRYLITHTA